MKWAGLALCLAAVAATPAMAQDMNTLDRHLEHQRWQRLQDHQNRSRTMKPKSPNAKKARGLARCTENHVPRAEYRRMKAEYDRKLRAEGKARAERWSRQQALQWEQRLKRQGVCR